MTTVHPDLGPGTRCTADDYDALVIPGGTVGADKLRGDPDAVAFI